MSSALKILHISPQYLMQQDKLFPLQKIGGTNGDSNHVFTEKSGRGIPLCKDVIVGQKRNDCLTITHLAQGY